MEVHLTLSFIAFASIARGFSARFWLFTVCKYNVASLLTSKNPFLLHYSTERRYAVESAHVARSFYELTCRTSRVVLAIEVIM